MKLDIMIDSNNKVPHEFQPFLRHRSMALNSSVSHKIEIDFNGFPMVLSQLINTGFYEVLNKETWVNKGGENE